MFENRPCYPHGLKPKRKDKDLILGTAWVDKSSLLVLHIEGETAKSPSWWVRSVQIKLSFGDLSGTWLQTGMEAVADVRLFGTHTLTSRILDYLDIFISASDETPSDKTPPKSYSIAVGNPAGAAPCCAFFVLPGPGSRELRSISWSEAAYKCRLMEVLKRSTNTNDLRNSVIVTAT